MADEQITNGKTSSPRGSGILEKLTAKDSSTPTKGFICEVCGKTFNRHYHLILHMRGHTGERPYTCPVCQHESKCIENYRKHWLTHASQRPLACNYCQKRFIRYSALKSHLNIHTGEKPHVCTECKHGYASPDSLGKHRKKGGVCCNCGSDFRCWTYFRLHLTEDAICCRSYRDKKKANNSSSSLTDMPNIPLSGQMDQLKEQEVDESNVGVAHTLLGTSEIKVKQEPLSCNSCSNGFDSLMSFTTHYCSVQTQNVSYEQQQQPSVSGTVTEIGSSQHIGSPIETLVKITRSEDSFVQETTSCTMCTDGFESITALQDHLSSCHSEYYISFNNARSVQSTEFDLPLNAIKEEPYECCEPMDKSPMHELDNEKEEDVERTEKLKQEDLIEVGKKQSKISAPEYTRKAISQYGLKKPTVSLQRCKFLDKAARRLSSSTRKHTSSFRVRRIVDSGQGFALSKAVGNGAASKSSLNKEKKKHVINSPLSGITLKHVPLFPNSKEDTQMNTGTPVNVMTESYICPTCGVVFNKYPLFQTHLKGHKGSNPFVCRICKKGFSIMASLWAHRKIHTKDQKCLRCQKSFSHRLLLEGHMALCSRRILKKKTYGTASDSIDYLSFLNSIQNQTAMLERSNTHLNLPNEASQTVHNDHLVCRRCLMTFRSASSLEHHVRSKMNCCPLTFQSSKNQHLHKDTKSLLDNEIRGLSAGKKDNKQISSPPDVGTQTTKRRMAVVVSKLQNKDHQNGETSANLPSHSKVSQHSENTSSLETAERPIQVQLGTNASIHQAQAGLPSTMSSKNTSSFDTADRPIAAQLETDIRIHKVQAALPSKITSSDRTAARPSSMQLWQDANMKQTQVTLPYFNPNAPTPGAPTPALGRSLLDHPHSDGRINATFSSESIGTLSYGSQAILFDGLGENTQTGTPVTIIMVSPSSSIINSQAMLNTETDTSTVSNKGAFTSSNVSCVPDQGILGLLLPQKVCDANISVPNISDLKMPNAKAHNPISNVPNSVFASPPDGNIAGIQSSMYIPETSAIHTTSSVTQDQHIKEKFQSQVTTTASNAPSQLPTGYKTPDTVLEYLRNMIGAVDGELARDFGNLINTT